VARRQRAVDECKVALDRAREVRLESQRCIVDELEVVHKVAVYLPKLEHDAVAARDAPVRDHHADKGPDRKNGRPEHTLPEHGSSTLGQDTSLTVRD